MKKKFYKPKKEQPKPLLKHSTPLISDDVMQDCFNKWQKDKLDKPKKKRRK